MVWIFLHHAAERIFGSPLFGNPTPEWPPFQERLDQFAPVPGPALRSIVLTLFRDFGWFGDQAVGLFLLASGFGLAWGLLKSGEPLKAREFYARRLLRLYPLWWALHIVVFVIWWARLGESGGMGFLRILQSMSGLRLDGSSVYRYVPAWWFFGLLVQLYIVFPLLWKAQARMGPWRLLTYAALSAIAVRAFTMAFQTRGLDPIIRGALFPSRLPEFVLGMALAVQMSRTPDLIERLQSARAWFASLVLWAAGTAASFTWGGLSVSPMLTTAGAFGLLLPFLTRDFSAKGPDLRAWIGVHSYAIFLIHQPVMDLLLPPSLAAGRPLQLLLTAFVTLGLALGLERGVGAIEAALVRRYRSSGPRKLALQAMALGALFVLALLGSELLVRARDPMENEGWGERASLEPDPDAGWKLKPSQTTRLRWESYDYRVSANELGFPGPLYPEARTPGSFRILVTGDAFSSAEGVDTDQAWPRLLEKELGRALPGRTVEVMNFAITGYGPNEYAAVMRKFVPRFRPDLVVVESFINDFGDVMLGAEEFREMIGFQKPPPDGLASILKCAHFRTWLGRRVLQPLLVRFPEQADPQGAFYVGIPNLVREPIPSDQVERLKRRFQEIRDVCAGSGARMLILIVPVAAQVCRPEQLPYWPRGTDLSDAARYDLDRPQRLIGGVAAGLGIPTLDVREAMRASPELTCQPWNLHWTAAGHRSVAGEASRFLRSGSWLTPADRR